MLVADGLTKEYGDVVALEDFTLSAEPGELVAMVGHNGSGKSHVPAARGRTARADGRGPRRRQRAGRLAEGARRGLVRARPAGALRRPERQRAHRVHRTPARRARVAGAGRRPARRVRAGRAGRRPAVRFSRGLRQKTSLVLGLVRPFSILLVDEPFVGLDPHGQAALTEVLVEAAYAGASVIVATHQLAFLEHATRCVALRDGHTEFAGAVDLARIQSPPRLAPRTGQSLSRSSSRGRTGPRRRAARGTDRRPAHRPARRCPNRG